MSQSVSNRLSGPAAKYFYLLDDSALKCRTGGNHIRFVFSKVMVVLRDSVTSIWTKYQQDNGIELYIAMYIIYVYLYLNMTQCGALPTKTFTINPRIDVLFVCMRLNILFLFIQAFRMGYSETQ